MSKKEKQNLKSLKKAYRRWDETKGESVEVWMDLMADEVEFGSLAGGAPGMEFTEQRKSKAEVAEYFAGLSVDWKMHHYTPERFLCDGNWVVMIGRCAFECRTTGKVVETAKADVVKFRDGRIVRFFEFFDTAAALAATRLEATA